MMTSRRDFVARAGLALAGGTLLSNERVAAAEAGGGERPLIVSTWPFGQAANERALEVLRGGGSVLDAVEQGIRLTEASGNSSVGLSGLPNAAGVVQLDACIMHGPGHQAGSVAGLEGIVHPITAARRVMERTRHVMLVGHGARMFALAQGLESVEIDSDRRHAEWQRAQASSQSPAASAGSEANHDTIALLALGADGTIAGGCSTSGLSGKLPGRVGDSPILGGGLYVDNEVGAAGATGIGENVMRYCGTFLVVELMRQGLHPRAACFEALRRIARKDPRGEALSVSFVALDKQGRFGAATAGQGFRFSVTTPTFSEVLESRGLGELEAVPEGGNQPPP